MRSFVLATAAAWLLAASGARAQDDARPETPAAPPAAAQAPAEVPKAAPAAAAAPGTGPIPYAELVAAARAKPHAAARPAAAPAVAPPAGARALPGARLQPGQPMPPAELEAFVDGAVKSAMRRDHIAGVAVAVVQNGQVLLKKGYGFASLSPPRPVDPDRTLFRLGGLSQAFTWIGLMRQAEAGRLRLDQPVNLYLPERLRVRDQGFDQPVRLLDLMSHSAGFDDRSLARQVEPGPEYVRPLEHFLRQERPRRVRAPGLAPSVASYGPALAGEAEAWVSGVPFERLMEQEIFLPLGMAHTTFREKRPVKAALPAPMPPALAVDAADGFHWKSGAFAPRPYEYMGQIAPAMSASSSAGDMARFMLAVLGGGQLNGTSIYGPATAQAFRTPILAAPPGMNGWAHGLRFDALPGGRTGYGLSGATLSFAADMVTVPELGLGVFVAVNTESGRALPEALPAAIVAEFYAPPAPFARPGAPELAAQAGLYEGRYLSTRRASSGLEGFLGLLVGAANVRVTPEGRLVTWGAAGGRSWTPEGPAAGGRFVALQGEDRLAFRMAGGRATAFQTSAGTQLFERISFWRSRDALALFAALAAAAAAISLVGAALRNRREVRQSAVQSRAALVQNIQAGLWIAAMASFALWFSRAFGDPARLVFNWPGAALVTASACALVAAALTVTTLFALPAVWRGGRRVDSWPILRRAAFTVTVMVFAVLSLLLARAGALSPWSG